MPEGQCTVIEIGARIGPGMRSAVGDCVSDARRNGERLGYFVVVGRDAVAVARHADELFERVHINVGADSSSP